MILDGADDRDIFYGTISDDAHNGQPLAKYLPQIVSPYGRPSVPHELSRSDDGGRVRSATVTANDWLTLGLPRQM